MKHARPFAALMILAGLSATIDPAQAQAQSVIRQGPVVGRTPDHPRLRAALHELREADREVRNARDAWPNDYRERALISIQDAINSIQAILQVKDVNTFVGVDRNPDFYKKYGPHPRLRAALQDLRDARAELIGATGNAGDLRGRAIDDVDVAIGQILTLIRYNGRPRR